MNDTCFSGSALVLFGGVLTAVTGALGLVFRLLMEAKDRQIDMALEIARGAGTTATLGAQAAEQAMSIARQERRQ